MSRNRRNQSPSPAPAGEQDSTPETTAPEQASQPVDTPEQEPTRPVGERPKHESLRAAVAAATLQFPRVLKNRKASFRTRNGNLVEYNFADYSDMVYLIAPILAHHGLTIEQITKPDGDKVGSVMLVTNLVHEQTGEVRESLFPVALDPDPKTFGARLTYAKRQQYPGVIGWAAAEQDVDGETSDETAQATRQNLRRSDVMGAQPATLGAATAPPPPPTSAAPAPTEQEARQFQVNQLISSMRQETDVANAAHAYYAAYKATHGDQTLIAQVFEAYKNHPKYQEMQHYIEAQRQAQQ